MNGITEQNSVFFYFHFSRSLLMFFFVRSFFFRRFDWFYEVFECACLNWVQCTMNRWVQVYIQYTDTNLFLSTLLLFYWFRGKLRVNREKKQRKSLPINRQLSLLSIARSSSICNCNVIKLLKCKSLRWNPASRQQYILFGVATM